MREPAHDNFNVYDYIDYMRQRWRLVALACVVAAVLTLGLTLLLAKRYTATASIIIEPPGANDVRTATAVSPIYLESLKSYERFAASDTLFARAALQFHLQEGSSPQPIESLKRRVLKVSKLRDTKILEISATLPDPVRAQKLAQFLAEETANLSRDENQAADREVIDFAQKQVAQARANLEAARAAQAGNAAREPITALQSEVDANTELLARVKQELLSTEGDAAEYQAREKALSSQNKEPGTELPFLRQQVDASRARQALLARRVAELEKSLAAKAELLGRRITRSEQVQTDLKTAEAAYDAGAKHLLDVQAAAGARGERLRVIDPGIVPQRPSSPNVQLNVMAGLLAAAVASVMFFSLQFAYRRGRATVKPELRPQRAAVR